MGNLFGRSKKVVSRVTEHDRVILQMKLQRDKLKQHRRQLENRLERERQVASRLVKEGKKDRALIILKKKKYMEKMIEKTESHLETIERLTQDVEWAQVEVNVVQNLEQGNQALKSLNALINLDDLEKMLDETRDAAEFQKEVNNLLIAGVSDIEMDDDALLAELDEIVGTKEPTTIEPALPKLPEVPGGDLVAEKADPASQPQQQTERTKPAKETPQMVPA